MRNCYNKLTKNKTNQSKKKEVSTMTKLTYAMAIDFATAIITNGTADFNGFSADEYLEKLESLKASLARRNGSERKPTKTQQANEGLKEDMWAYVSENGPKRAGDIAGYFNISGQKASALLNALVKEGRLDKVAEKRVTYFRVVEA